MDKEVAPNKDKQNPQLLMEEIAGEKGIPIYTREELLETQKSLLDLQEEDVVKGQLEPIQSFLRGLTNYIERSGVSTVAIAMDAEFKEGSDAIYEFEMTYFEGGDYSPGSVTYIGKYTVNPKTGKQYYFLAMDIVIPGEGTSDGPRRLAQG